MQFFHLKFAVTSVIKIYSKMWEILVPSGLWSFVYSINLQKSQIPATNHHFSCKKCLLLCGSRFLKKKTFFLAWDLVTTAGAHLGFSEGRGPGFRKGADQYKTKRNEHKSYISDNSLIIRTYKSRSTYDCR